jgi:DNA-binding winged helix-turn-helix (wHTH) protein
LTFQASPYQSAPAIVKGRSSNHIVGYDARRNAIIKLRKALGDKACSPHIIETIAKTGYRLIAEVSLKGEVEQPSPMNVQP